MKSCERSMLSVFVNETELDGRQPVPLHAVLAKDLERFLESARTSDARWLKATAFAAKDGELALVPDPTGGLGAAVLGLGKGRDPHALALFPERLPAGVYTLGDVPSAFAGMRAAYAWAIGSYAFERYRGKDKKGAKEHPRLVLPAGVDGESVSRIATGVFLGRDLINTPSNDMGPAELEDAARTVAERFGARIDVITGDELLRANYPMIHAVGRASVRAPRLIDIVWGEDRHPKVSLIGKGVCFDTGGLDLKNSSGMATMKKDMGGAACVLGLAHMIMDAKLPVRLRVMVPAVENSVSGSAYRPGDVIPSRKGLYVEIGNTDAEGRLVLADALTEADTENPALMFCLATLTGAARAATGMELPPFFTDDETLAADLARHGTEQNDPVWRLPLWRGYEPTVDSAIADINNAPDYPLAGAITAALFLNRFISKTQSWAHFDIPAWIDRPKPGRRKGAEANAIRAMFAVIEQRYGTRT
jgi:leucyl aminopeptidase